MNNQLLVRLLVYFSIIMLLTGCWDQVDIEDRGFVAGVAIDKSSEDMNDHDRITLMNQFVVPEKMGGVEQGAGAEKPFTNLSASGNTLFEIRQEISLLTGRQPYYEHLKIIVKSAILSNSTGTRPI